MESSADRVIPIFPLAIVVFPGQPIPLHIFEERYKTMIADCEPESEGDEFRPFGMSLFADGEVAAVGSTLVVTEVLERFDDGSMNIATEGRQRYRSIERFEDRPYMTARVEFFEDDDGHGDPALSRAVRERHRELIDLAAAETRGGQAAAAPSQDDPARAFDIAVNAGLDLQQKQRLLEMNNENERLQLLLDHLQELLPRLKEKLETQKRVKSNGHARS